MNTYTNKTTNNKSQSVASSVAQKKNNGKNSAIVDNRPKSVLQRKIEDGISNNNVIQLADHPKKASGTGMDRKDPGHGQVKSKQHAAARAKLDGKREAKRAELRKHLQQKRAAAAAAAAAKTGR
ncbi:hypothetical protein [Flavobacterium sharifuzzamanii]|uniref:hypothetical protein n=1 Tax=Flavobacterium sharifuzzamanii TaxID=2211133 RepID=UPI000DADA90B|nr:hypothetical protein [Flavobacterium sharifuzzamanii]KAF2082361.1 hypothetical protein DMA14_03330 [Flavobacterium sharifuzzamanii]